MKTIANRVGIIVPYRNRAEHIATFLQTVPKYFEERKTDYRIIIVHQDDAKLFNRGMLLNVGFTYAEKLKCEYVVFHDVDIIPVDCDYSYSDKPIHLISGELEGERKMEMFDEYFGGITIFPSNIFREINGYSNKYWGWGYEDTDLLLRCEKMGVELDSLKIKNMGGNYGAVKFNGIDSRVLVKNRINFRNDLSFFMSFCPDDLICDHTRESDLYTVFSVPGYDFSINYTSFSRYNFCAFDDEENVLYVNSKIKTNYKTNMCVTVDNANKTIRVYQDGVFIGQTKYVGSLMKYQKEKFFYLGVGHPEREGDERFFRGTIDTFIIFSEILEDAEIKNISKVKKYLNSKTYKNRLKNNGVVLSYSADKINDAYELIDLSGNNNNGSLINCDVIKENHDEFTEIKIPFRRKSALYFLPHEEGGFVDNKWKDQQTRWNQLRYVNEVSKNDELVGSEGLSDLSFVQHNKIYEEKTMYVNVGI
jgi:hypothetical protein